MAHPAPAVSIGQPDFPMQGIETRLRAFSHGSDMMRVPGVAFSAGSVAGLARRIELPQAEVPAEDHPMPADALPLPPAPPEPDPTEILRAARDEAYSAGFTAGHATGLTEGREAGRKQAQQELAQGMAEAKATFLAAIKGMEEGADALSARLSASLHQAVIHLASQRAGSAIDASPAAFLERIDALADRVAQGLRQVRLRLHPDDLAAILPLLEAHDGFGAEVIETDPAMMRGDAEIRAEGVTLSDLLASGIGEPA